MEGTMNKTKSLIISGILVTLSGCGATHFNEKQTVETNEVVFLDAKQRSVFRVDATQKVDVDGKEELVNFSGICAEPSPDAISSLATSLGVELSVADKGKLGISQSISEAVGNIGIRTAAIQALRDMMYRNCEAYGIGAVSKMGLETLQRRFQTTMVAILAIEQLTGAVKAPAITLTGQSSVGDADAIIGLTNKSEVARQAHADAQKIETTVTKTFDEAKTKHDGTSKKIEDDKVKYDLLKAKNPPSPAQADIDFIKNYDKLLESLPTEKTAMDEAEAAQIVAKDNSKKTKQAYEAVESSRMAALTAGGKTSSSASIESIASSSTINEKTAGHVSKAVVDIVKESLKMDFGKEVCTTLIGQHSTKVAEENTPLWHCMQLLLISQLPDDEKKETVDGLLIAQVGEAYANSMLLAEKIKSITEYINPNGTFDKARWDALVDKSNLNKNDTKSLKGFSTLPNIKSLLQTYSVLSSKKSIISTLRDNIN